DLRDSAELKAPAHWTFNKPVMMLQYITSEQYDGSDNLTPPRGDPSSVVLETREQYQTDVVYATPPDSDGYVSPDGAQYVNVFIDGGASGTLQDSLLVDGNLVKHLPPLPYYLKNEVQVPGTTFWALHIQVPGGIHHLRAKTPFSAYAVGFKLYESYAWACALSLKLIGTNDTIPPIFPDSLSCGTLTDTLTDLPSVDSVRSNLAQQGDDSSGIGWVYNGHYPDTTYNFNDTVLPKTFTPGDSNVVVHIQVTNLRNKAHGALYAIDRAGNDTTFYYNYTPDSVVVTPYFLNYGKVASNTSKLDTIIIKNPFATSVTIDSIWLAQNNAFTILSGGTPPPFTLTPGAQRDLIIKFASGSDSGFVNDTVEVKFNCFSRPLAVLGGGSGKPCVSVNDLDFGALTILGGSAQHDSTLEIYNNGTDTLIITGLRLSGGAGSAFSITSPATPVVVPIKVFPGDSLTVTIHFAITAVGSYRDSLLITSDANKTCTDSIAVLTGIGQQPGPHIKGFDWGNRRVSCSFLQSDGFTVQNTGSAPDTLNGLQVLSPINDFVFSTVQLPLPLPANNGQGSIPVTFTPTDTGYRFAVIRAKFTSGSTVTDTLLRGTGVHPLIASQDINFGLQSIGFSTDTIAVAVNVPKTYFDSVPINSVALGGANPGDFSILFPNIPKVLADTGDTIQVRIAFSPTAVGIRTAQLCFHHDGTFSTCKADTTYCITLTGTGQTPGLLARDWDAGRVFITTTHDTTLSVVNLGNLPATVDSMWLSQNKVFHIAAGVATKNVNVPAVDSIPVQITFTPADTLSEYYDTLIVANSTQTPLVYGYVQGRGKVAIYTAIVANNVHGFPGQNVRIPINVPMGYTRPSAVDPGDPTPLDSGSMNALNIGLQFNPRVLQPLAADNTIFDLGGTLANGYTATRTPSAKDSVVFQIAGTNPLSDSGTLVYTNFHTLYSNVVSMPIYDTVSTAVPYVIWKLVPGMFFVDSVCGLGPSSTVIYNGNGAVALGQSIPNPMMVSDGQSTAIIPFALAAQSDVRLDVYNSIGNQVANVISGNLPQGLYNARFDARNLPAGLYYYRLVTGAGAQTRTMMLMR
ncbi:MAG TPA: choice-of-anchor D domain-containing protein, partial [Candidatus Kapabacteria bacterium]|nr:choice-of-anchor D domain-containing protein [Candidatus Kapabacteria bacterium]